MTICDEIAAIKAPSSIDAVGVVLYQALSKSATTTVDYAARYCATHSFESAGSCADALSLLKGAGLILIKDGVISITMDDEAYRTCQDDSRRLRSEVASRLFSLLVRTMSLSILFPPGSLSYGNEGERLVINENLIPFDLRGIKLNLINFGVLRRLNSYGLLIVEQEYQTYFENTLIPIIAAEMSAGGTDLDSLHRMLKQREKRGDAAEQYVVDFERERLSVHRNRRLIKRVSDKNVSCGYDILSFESVNSGTIDRFIEVKSYQGRCRFFWTRNEVNVSKALGINYYLYLVDSERFEDAGYAPTIIRNPNREVLSEDSKYQIDTEVFLIQLRN